MPPSFFNSREDALLIGTAVILAYAICKSPREIVRSFFALARSLLVPKILVLYTVALGYSAALVHAAARTGLWHEAAFTETVYWFVGTAAVLVGQAAVTTEGSPSLARRVLGRVLAITVFVEVAGNLYAFPLGVELPLTFVMLLFVMLQAYAPYDANVTPGVRSFIDAVVALIGFAYLSYFVARAAGDFQSFASKDTLEDMLVGPVLTLFLLPILYTFSRWSRHEQRALRRRLYEARADLIT